MDSKLANVLVIKMGGQFSAPYNMLTVELMSAM